MEAIVERLQLSVPAKHIVWHEAEPATDQAILRVHTEEHLDRLTRMHARGGGQLDADTAMSAHSLDAARHAAAAAVLAARLALRDGVAFSPVRPPGHHATSGRAMGFCLINNVAVAAYTALEELELTRVLIVDWDVHHGNGTQAIVEADPRIRYVSLHQWPLYPGTGLARERGVGNVFNVPRPPGRPPSEHVSDLADAVERAIDGWTPELLLISAGFDAMAGDPLAGFTLEPEHYAAWTTAWRGMGCPITSVLEGGYIPQRIAGAAAAHIGAL